jgi:hypothetical protein
MAYTMFPSAALQALTATLHFLGTALRPLVAQSRTQPTQESRSLLFSFPGGYLETGCLLGKRGLGSLGPASASFWSSWTPGSSCFPVSNILPCR